MEVTLAEEEVARLSGELEWLRQETRHGDRKVEELEDQVTVARFTARMKLGIARNEKRCVNCGTKVLLLQMPLN